MAAPKSVWGIDIGQCALKALKLREVDGQLEAEAFEIIEHPQLLSEPDANREELIRNSLEEFVARNDLTGCGVTVAVPGQTSFTRFVKMPPVEPKKIPDLVRFEAEQQIPFDINEVIWRWQSFSDPDSPEVEVGLFAMKRTDVYSVLDPFTEMLIGVNTVQMAPLALYNFMTYDRQIAAEGATLLVDMGAEGTDLVVADGARLWTRTIQLGGNNFTEALAKAFKLSFAKAEKLKRTAATSKYARQVFQAMRPVFADLVQEIQRSIGYYTSLHRNAKFSRILGVGNGFRLPGLQKFLEQNLSTPVIRVDELNALQPSATISAPQFTENILGFAVAYGLAIQGLGLTRIDTNLLPNEISSARQWTIKRPWFAAAGALLIAATLGWAWREFNDHSILDTTSNRPEALATAERIDREYRGFDKEYRQVQSSDRGEKAAMQAVLKIMDYRDYWPSILEVVTQSVRDVAAHQGLMVASKAASAKSITPGSLQCIMMSSLTSEFVPAPADKKAAEQLLSGGANKTGGQGRPMGGAGMLGAPRSSSSNPSGEQAIRLILTAKSPMDRRSLTAMLNRLRQRSVEVAPTIFGDKIEIMACEVIGFTEGVAPAATDGVYNTGRGGGMTGGMGMFGPGGMMGPGRMGPGQTGGQTGVERLESNAAAEVLDLDNDVTGRPVEGHTTFEMGWILRIRNEQTVQ